MSFCFLDITRSYKEQLLLQIMRLSCCFWTLPSLCMMRYPVIQWWMSWWGFPLFSLVCTQLTFKWRRAQGRGNKTSLLSLTRPRSFSPSLSFIRPLRLRTLQAYIPPFLAFSSRQCQGRVAISRRGTLFWLDTELFPLFYTLNTWWPWWSRRRASWFSCFRFGMFHRPLVTWNCWGVISLLKSHSPLSCPEKAQIGNHIQFLIPQSIVTCK